MFAKYIITNPKTDLLAAIGIMAQRHMAAYGESIEYYTVNSSIWAKKALAIPTSRKITRTTKFYMVSDAHLADLIAHKVTRWI